MSEIEVVVLDNMDDGMAAALARLLPQVSSRAAPLTVERAREVVGNSSTYVAVACRGDEVLAMGLLVTCTTLAGQFGLVEEVAVEESARGHHLGVRVMVHLVTLAKTLDLEFLELTSRPSREAANGLYQSIGFRRRETNVYRHNLEELPELR